MKYDYIVIGAGSAGAILATRLTEDPDVSIMPDCPRANTDVTTMMIAERLASSIRAEE